VRYRRSTEAAVSLQFSVVSGELGSGRQVVAAVDVATGTVMGSVLASGFELVVGVARLISETAR
jgi:hypothetical protein